MTGLAITSAAGAEENSCCSTPGAKDYRIPVRLFVARGSLLPVWNMHCVSEVQGGRMVDLTEQPLEVGSLAHETCSDDYLGVRE